MFWINGRLKHSYSHILQVNLLSSDGDSESSQPTDTQITKNRTIHLEVLSSLSLCLSQVGEVDMEELSNDERKVSNRFYPLR